VAHADVVSRRFQLCQFVDSTNLDNLESVVVQLAAKECLVAASADGDGRASTLCQLLQRSGVAITERKKGFTNQFFCGRFAQKTLQSDNKISFLLRTVLQQNWR